MLKFIQLRRNRIDSVKSIACVSLVLFLTFTSTEILFLFTQNCLWKFIFIPVLLMIPRFCCHFVNYLFKRGLTSERKTSNSVSSSLKESSAMARHVFVLTTIITTTITTMGAG
ncbi:hypothetical protein [Shewanella sedimentimangrovi]|uniref:Uncharacterized protein n=1 Tax=Shewanella sedimentimangrovi TaxID=2814293 RepID=A0ABX7R5G2_9GAMM|nr:hypothetical protein [Shewanella sedimentimangrovi]QSX38063.1 hypothetical protein JYB85_04300 [Shewanella sedimentimangrovi]